MILMTGTADVMTESETGVNERILQVFVNSDTTP